MVLALSLLLTTSLPTTLLISPRPVRCALSALALSTKFFQQRPSRSVAIDLTDPTGEPFVVIVGAGEEWMWGGDPCGRPGIRQQYLVNTPRPCAIRGSELTGRAGS